MRKLLFTALALLTLSLPFGCQKESTDQLTGDTAVQATDRSAITLPAGSHNALQEALDNYTTVILAPGLHIEDDMVVVSGKRHIVGQSGAVLQSGAPFQPDLALPISAALHFNGAGGSSIKGVQMNTPGGNPGGAAILIEASPNVSVERCTMTGFEFGIIVEQSPSVRIYSNTMTSILLHGITIVNGAGAVVEDNEVTAGFFGIWACDKDGVLRRNNTHGNFIGIILCKVPEGGLVLPSGQPTGAQYPGTNWTARNNNSHGNIYGYLVIDGANNNLLQNNDASQNVLYDYELTTETDRFGFWVPGSFENTVHAKAGQTVKDCGVDNVVTGGILIDTTIDPCN